MLGLVGAAAAHAETIFAPANRSTGTRTSSQYSGLVTLQISGTASGLSGEVSDAFYRPGFDPNRDVGYYLLSFNVTSSISSPTRDVKNFLVGSIPPYDTSGNGNYTVVIDTGISVSSPSYLYFGFTDGGYGDNTGGYSVTLTPGDITASAAPEPSTIALMASAFGVLALRRRKRPV